MRNKVENIMFVGILLFLFGYFLQWLDISFLDIHNEFTVFIGGLLCLYLVIKQKKIRIDLETCLIAITLIIYFVKDLGLATAIRASYFYVAMVIYVLAHYMAFEIKKDERHEDKLRLVITIMAVAITIHGILNSYMFLAGYIGNIRMWRDMWSYEIIYGTMQVAYFLPAFVLIFPALFFPRKKRINSIFWILSTLLFIYIALASQTRMPVLIMPLVFALQIIFYIILERHNIKRCFNKKRLLILVTIIISGLAIMIIVLCNTTVGQTFLGIMSRDGGILNNIRFKIQRSALEQLFVYPMGGNMMDHLGQAHTHNAWLDIADIGGVIPFFAFVIYTLLTIYELIKLLLKKDVTTGTKVLCTGFFVAYFIFFTIEPSLDWSVHFMTPWLFLNGLIHGYVKEEKRGIKCFFP